MNPFVKNTSIYIYAQVIMLGICLLTIFYLLKVNEKIRIIELELSKKSIRNKKLSNLLDSIEFRQKTFSKGNQFIYYKVPVHTRGKSNNIKITPDLTLDNTNKINFKDYFRMQDSSNNHIKTPCSFVELYTIKVPEHNIYDYKTGYCKYALNIYRSILKINVDFQNKIVCSATYDVNANQTNCNSIYGYGQNKYNEHYVMVDFNFIQKGEIGKVRDCININFDNKTKTAPFKVSVQIEKLSFLKCTLIWGNGSEFYFFP